MHEKKSQIASKATVLVIFKWKARNNLMWLLVCMCSCEEWIIELKNYILLKELWAVLSGRYQYWCYIINTSGKRRKNLLRELNNSLSKACWQPVLRISQYKTVDTYTGFESKVIRKASKVPSQGLSQIFSQSCFLSQTPCKINNNQRLSSL